MPSPLPPPFRRIRWYAFAAIPVLFLLAFAAVIWYHTTSSPIVLAMLIVPIAMLRVIPKVRYMLEEKARNRVRTLITHSQIPCSMCESPIQIERDKTCPMCGCTLTIAEHRSRWGV